MLDYLHDTLKVITNSSQIISKLKSIVQGEISRIRSNSTHDISSDGSSVANVITIKNSRNRKRLTKNKSQDVEKIETTNNNNNIKPVHNNDTLSGNTNGVVNASHLKISLVKKEVKKSVSPCDTSNSKSKRKKISLYKIDKDNKSSFEINKNFELKNELQSRENSNGKLSVSKIRNAFKKAFKSLKGNIFKQNAFEKNSKKNVAAFKEDLKPKKTKSKTDLEKYNSLKIMKKNKANFMLTEEDKKDLNFSGYDNHDDLFKRIQSNLGDNFKNFFNFSYDKYHENFEGNHTKTIDSGNDVKDRHSILSEEIGDLENGPKSDVRKD
jgi:hypothetical protein